MDALTKSLNTYLVSMAYEGATHEQEHLMEHLLALLDPTDEQLLVNYYGLFNEPRLSLNELAHNRQEQPEETMTHIDQCLRRIAITPEWQMLRTTSH